MDISTWEYRDEDGDGKGERHIGPMAEDFHDPVDVDVGTSDEHINSINADGVLFAAVQGLNEKLEEKDDRTEELESENEELIAENGRLQERVATIAERLATLEAASASAPADD